MTGKYPAYSVRDDTEELGTLSIVDEKGQTLFIRDRTCLGILEDAYLMTAAPKLAYAVEVLWDFIERVNEEVALDEDSLEYLSMVAEDALESARTGEGPYS